MIELNLLSMNWFDSKFNSFVLFDKFGSKIRILFNSSKYKPDLAKLSDILKCNYIKAKLIFKKQFLTTVPIANTLQVECRLKNNLSNRVTIDTPENNS